MSSSDDEWGLHSPQMSAYESRVWDSLNTHWDRRNNKRGLPNWAATAVERTGEATRKAAQRVAEAIPDAVSDPIQRAGEAVALTALRPTVAAAVSLLDLVNSWVMELNDPAIVEKIARKGGVEISSFRELRHHDLQVCDRLLTAHTLKWRTTGALEGGAMGLLALVPVAGPIASLAADALVVQALSTAIATRIAYSYGYDPRDPEEQAFIQRLVTRSFKAQAIKAKPLNEVAQAAYAIKGRVNWSAKLREDHRLIAALEKLMQHAGPSASRVPVQHVAKALPYVGVVIGAGTNATVLGNVAEDAKRFSQTRFLCEKYELPLPTALASDDDETPVG
jgi:hypothetical protein